MLTILVGGSRSLSPSPVLAQLVGRLLGEGHCIHVGCSTGADAQVLQCAGRSSSFPQVRVFAAFSSSGTGSCSASAVAELQAWALSGGSVQWLAGGELAVPLAGRLICRSFAALAGCSGAIFFEPGAGSLAVAGEAVRRGLHVFVFASAYPGRPRGAAGQWVQSSLCGLACWQWQPEAEQEPLL